MRLHPSTTMPASQPADRRGASRLFRIDHLRNVSDTRTIDGEGEEDSNDDDDDNNMDVDEVDDDDDDDDDDSNSK